MSCLRTKQSLGESRNSDLSIPSLNTLPLSHWAPHNHNSIQKGVIPTTARWQSNTNERQFMQYKKPEKQLGNYKLATISQFVIEKFNEPVHEISNNVVYATSKASDQPARMRSLIRAFASRLSILRLSSY